MWVFNTVSLEWKRIDVGGAAPAPREMASGTMLNSCQMLVFGGRSPSGTVLNDSVVLDMASVCWKQAKTHGDFGRCTHSAVLLRKGGASQVSHSASYLISLKRIGSGGGLALRGGVPLCAGGCKRRGGRGS